MMMTRGASWSRTESVGEDVVVVDIYLARIEQPIRTDRFVAASHFQARLTLLTKRGTTVNTLTYRRTFDPSKVIITNIFGLLV